MVKSWKLSQVLGGCISSGLSWNSHIDRITRNANRTLGYIRRNIKSKNQKVIEITYITLVRPQLEYAAPIWNPYTKGKTLQLEKVQRRATHGRTVITFTVKRNSHAWPTQLDGWMPAFVSSTRWSMELWQYRSQITSSIHIECPNTVTWWHFVRFIQIGIIISTYSLHSL